MELDANVILIVEAVCRKHQVTRNQIRGRERTRTLIAARYELWWQLRHHPLAELTYDAIGTLFDRNHSTIVRGVRSHRQARRAAGLPLVPAKLDEGTACPR